uniref:SET domain-containing protein n=1 Tax=Attheya septentrionalis TaxID=420275 RepID=A0A7S2XTE3_9STRA|mmetsp:Transcript_9833/g.17902  ORF Transcript_9833/g.17902 Transcript_9833/m.17902 type:complete len:326 (+) Transcript_9833:69-1046(+)
MKMSSSLTDWLKELVRVQSSGRVEIRPSRHGGLGGFALVDLKAGDVVFEIPNSLILSSSSKRVVEHPVVKKLVAADLDSNITLETLLFVYIISVRQEHANNDDDNNDNDNDNSGISKVDSLTKMAVVILEKIRNDTTNNKDSKLANVVDDLEIAVKTNRGIALIMVGKPMEAMKCFQEASICSCHRSKNGPTSSSSTSTTRLEPHVNIFLSLWKHGYHNDAARVWLRARDMDNNNDDSKATNHDSYSTRLNKTIQEYALLMVGQQQQQQKTVKDKSMVFVEGPHIPSWVVEQKGTTSQLLALDIIALRQVLASQTKHAAKSHLRL